MARFEVASEAEEASVEVVGTGEVPLAIERRRLRRGSVRISAMSKRCREQIDGAVRIGLIWSDTCDALHALTPGGLATSAYYIMLPV